MTKFVAILISVVLVFTATAVAFADTNLQRAYSCKYCGDSHVTVTHERCHEHGGDVLYRAVPPSNHNVSGHENCTLLYAYVYEKYSYSCRNCLKTWTSCSLVRTGDWMCNDCA